jgi:hypothetical protein
VYNVKYSDFHSNGTNATGNVPAGLGQLSGINANGDSCDAWYNIFLDPLLADTGSGDYHLTWANWPTPDSTKSPCIDAGDPSEPFDPDGTRPDIGAFYFNQLRPLIFASDSLLDFGIVDIGQSLDFGLTLHNGGTDSLCLHSMLNQHSEFIHNWNPADSLILPGDSLIITITFTPLDTNMIVDTLFIDNNDKPIQVRLSGKGKIVVGIEDPSDLPKVYTLYPAYPNPFNPITHIAFDIPSVGRVTLTIYDILGRNVSTLVNRQMTPGRYEVTWDAGNLPSGLYFYRFEAGEFTDLKKMILMK